MKITKTSQTDQPIPPEQSHQVQVEPRRTGHGGMAWVHAIGLRQPQDGASDESTLTVKEVFSLRGRRTRLNEPEDARLTGATRSLARRLLGLNLVQSTLTTAVQAAIKPTRTQILAVGPRIV